VDEDFPFDLNDFGYATARLLAEAGMREEVKLLAAQEHLKPLCIEHDNWNGGQWTWQFDLSLPLRAHRSLEPRDRETIIERITTAMREVLRAFEAHSIAPVRIVMEMPKANATWKADAKAWATGAGLSNQGRVRSTNIAPFEDDGLLFRSKPEILLYRALKVLGVTLAPLPVFVRGGSAYRRLEPDFVLVHRGVMMVVEVDGDSFHNEAPVDAHERLAVLSREGVHTERVRAEDCATDARATASAAHLLEVLDKLASNR
jgi:hypothetical protein